MKNGCLYFENVRTWYQLNDMGSVYCDVVLHSGRSRIFSFSASCRAYSAKPEKVQNTLRGASGEGRNAPDAISNVIWRKSSCDMTEKVRILLE